MWIRVPKAVIGLALTGGLAGCASYAVDPAIMADVPYSAEVSRSVDAVIEETPFVNGPISVVATENGELRTYRLYPCRMPATVCGGSERGPAGSLTLTPDHYVVSGIYGDRTFFLRPGGGGTLRRGGVDMPLVWNAYVNGFPRQNIAGIYPDATFPTVRY